MKNSILIIALCLFFFGFNQNVQAQNWSNWSQWKTIDCYKGISWRSQTREGAGKYRVRYEIKNHYSHGVEFDHFVSSDESRRAIYHITLKAGESKVNEEWVDNKTYYLLYKSI